MSQPTLLSALAAMLHGSDTPPATETARERELRACLRAFADAAPPILPDTHPTHPATLVGIVVQARHVTEARRLTGD